MTVRDGTTGRCALVDEPNDGHWGLVYSERWFMITHD